ncbi:dihydroorotate dehydrogenase electron transfer subunit [Patescibacteria group bacterium]|nr:dihydroorotate dehydrogenase electron transfer subunit [Patescibacteria group bacterium]MBU1954131.1 dihydroorotate dehydrogenase electron transfer subunit [Patescibacteria group bacterium]
MKTKFDIPKTVPIKKIIVETPFVKTFIFEYELGARPGQFVNLWLPGVDEKPMSVAYCDEKEFWVTMFAVGPFSKAMHELKEGDLVGVRGPYGKGFSFEKDWRLVGMGGGYGAAPLYFLTVEAVKLGCHVDFVVGARGKEHLLYIDRVKKLKNVDIHIATDDGSVGIKGYNTVILQQLIEEAKSGSSKKIDMVYACGPEMMMKTISNICFEHGINAELSVERYMKCGFGVCGQCSVDDSGIRMCKEGPVVSNEVARKITEFGRYHRDSVGRVHEF